MTTYAEAMAEREARLERLRQRDEKEKVAAQIVVAQPTLTANATEQKQSKSQQAEDGFQEYTAEEIAEFGKNAVPVSEPRAILQPDLNGEFPTPLDGALWMAVTYGIPQVPLRGKAPFLPNWPDKASADPAQIRKFAAEYPGCNFGSVAFAGKHFIFEADSVAVRERFKNQSPGHDFTSHLIIESSPGKGHRYYLSAPGVENIGQNEGQDYSIRADGEQCVSPGSIHPVTQRQYRVAVHNGRLGQPTAEEILFWKNQRPEKKSAEVQEQAPIPEGKRNSALASMAGKLLDAGMSPEKVKQEISEVNEVRCVPPLSHKELEDTIFYSIDTKWSKKEDAITRQVTAPPVPFAIGQVQQPQNDVAPQDWRSQFRNLSEMEQGDIVMIIDGVLQEGITFIGANPGHGKTLVALAFAKSISLGTALFGIPEYTVKQPRNVVYLIPESGDRAFRRRGEAFRLPQDDRFIARTISSGGPLALSDPALMEAVRQMKPVVILDTASRFLQAIDENSAAQNRLLVNDVIALRAAGAACVIILHHAKKAQGEKREPMTLDNMLRGTSDFGAMCDQAYGIRMDEHLYNRGAGLMEIELVNLKDRERLGGLTSIRLAASYRKPGSIFPASYIDETGDFRPVDYKETKGRDEATLNSLVEANPMMTVTELCEATGMKPHTVKETLKRFGWHMAKGGPEGHSPWHKDISGVCPYKPGKKSAVRQSQADVNFDAPARVN